MVNEPKPLDELLEAEMIVEGKDAIRRGTLDAVYDYAYYNTLRGMNVDEQTAMRLTAMRHREPDELEE